MARHSKVSEMKQLLGIITIVLAVTYVASESCTVAGDCSATSCGGSSTVVCQHPDGDGVVAGGGLCTCSDSTSGQCNSAPDCYGDKAPNLTCPDERRHCYDNQCICSRWPGGGGK